MADIIICGIILMAVFFAVRSLIKKKGGCCDCSSCGGNCHCSEKK